MIPMASLIIGGVSSVLSISSVPYGMGCYALGACGQQGSGSLDVLAGSNGSGSAVRSYGLFFWNGRRTTGWAPTLNLHRRI